MNLETAPETAPAIPESSVARRAEDRRPLVDVDDLVDEVVDNVGRPPPIAREETRPGFQEEEKATRSDSDLAQHGRP